MPAIDKDNDKAYGLDEYIFTADRISEKEVEDLKYKTDYSYAILFESADIEYGKLKGRIFVCRKYAVKDPAYYARAVARKLGINLTNLKLEEILDPSNKFMWIPYSIYLKEDSYKYKEDFSNEVEKYEPPYEDDSEISDKKLLETAVEGIPSRNPFLLEDRAYAMQSYIDEHFHLDKTSEQLMKSIIKFATDYDLTHEELFKLLSGIGIKKLQVYEIWDDDKYKNV